MSKDTTKDVIAKLPPATAAVVVPFITELRNRCLLAGVEGMAMMFAVGLVASELTEAAELSKRARQPRDDL